MLNGVYVRFFNSFIYNNLCVICKNFGWLVDNFFCSDCKFVQFIFGRHHRKTISATVYTMNTLLRELFSLREGHLFLDGGCQLRDLSCGVYNSIIIHCVCCVHVSYRYLF